MSKSIFSAGLIEGLFLAVSLKTGVDPSQGGIAIAFLQALRPIAPSSFPLDLTIWGITIVGLLALGLLIWKHPVEAGSGFLFGLFLGTR